MKHKSLICLTLTFLIAFSVFSVTTLFINAATAPVLSVVLSGTLNTYSIPARGVGSTFKVDVRVDDVSSVTLGINSASYSLTWNPAVLTCTSKTDNTWLPSQSNLGDLPLNGTSGVDTIGQIAFSLTNASASTTTPSVSATFTFQVVSTGSSVIGLEPSSIGVAYLDYPNNEGVTTAVIGTTTVNATYGSSSTTPTSTVHGPIANFTPSDGSSFMLGSSITLNATLSQPGYDTETCPITNYAWSVEYLNGTTLASFTGENATFNAMVVGTFRIILIVTAVDIHSPSNPSYESADSTSAIINVISSTSLVNIDVFTDQSGTGPTVSSRAYGPLQLVQMYASVTYDSASMPEENVIFSIKNSNDSVIAVRQGITNQTGIASANFRLPTPDPSAPQNSFGIWSVTASVTVIDVAVSNTTNFTFNYQSGIENVTIPASVYRNETLPIQLIINNQELSTQWTQLSITLFDQARIPIGSSTLTATQQTQSLTVIDATITIPSWAFPGQATVYLCLLTNSTNVPIAPESIANFTILS